MQRGGRMRERDSAQRRFDEPSGDAEDAVDDGHEDEQRSAVEHGDGEGERRGEHRLGGERRHEHRDAEPREQATADQRDEQSADRSGDERGGDDHRRRTGLLEQVDREHPALREQRPEPGQGDEVAGDEAARAHEHRGEQGEPAAAGVAALPPHQRDGEDRTGREARRIWVCAGSPGSMTGSMRSTTSPPRSAIAGRSRLTRAARTSVRGSPRQASTIARTVSGRGTSRISRHATSVGATVRITTRHDRADQARGRAHRRVGDERADPRGPVVEILDDAQHLGADESRAEPLHEPPGDHPADDPARPPRAPRRRGRRSGPR